MKQNSSESPYFIEALARGLQVLGLFSKEHPTLSMSDVVELSGLSKATAFRILSTLESTGYLVRNSQTKQYRPGMRVLSLGFSAINSLDFRQLARPHLETLAAELNLTTSLAVLDGMSVIYVDRIRNRAIVGVLLGIGDRIPAHCSSMGKVILANLPEEELDALLTDFEFERCTSQSIKTRQELEAELDQVGQMGYALNDSELYSGLRAVAAPIFDAQARVVAAVNVSGSHDEISPVQLRDELPARIIDIAGRISQTVAMAGA